MARQWTVQQLQAIESRGKSLLVSAAAGSGKTSVLVERVIRLLEEGMSLENLLVVTFTRAAAAEMRGRIAEALQASPALSRSQLPLLNQADISTLHVFCQNALRRHAAPAGLDYSFAVAGKAQQEELFQRALSEALEEGYERADPNFLWLSETFSYRWSDAGLEEMLWALHEFLQARPDPEAFLRDAAAMYAAEDLSASPWLLFLEEEFRRTLEGAAGLLNEALRIARLPDGPLNYEAALVGEIGRIGKISGKYDALIDACANFSFSRLPPARGCDEKLKKAAASLRDRAKRLLGEIAGQAKLCAQAEILKKLRPLTENIASTYLSVAERYRALKQARNLLDFSDLEHRTLALFADEAIASEYRERFCCILFDEYQDANAVQEAIIRSIARPDNLFLVGDGKQSIYRFRQADPGLFFGKLRAYPDTPGCAVVDLNLNFRSRAPIIKSVNFFFSHLMSPDLGEIAYDARQALYPGLPPAPDRDPPVRLHLFCADSAARDGREAAQAVRIVRETLGKVFYDSSGGASRRFAPGDFAILSRSMAPTRAYIEAFERAQIPLSVQSAFSGPAPEVLEVLDFLRAVDNSRQDVPLLVALKSPAGGFSAEDLAQIRLSCADPKAPFHLAARRRAEEADALGARLKAFFAFLLGCKGDARRKGVSEFLTGLLDQTGWLERQAALPAGAQRRLNLLALCDAAREMGCDSSLTGYLHEIGLALSSGELPAPREQGEAGDAVRMMTIHGSKGLEFPVVILCGAGRKFNREDLRDRLMTDPELGLAPLFIDVAAREKSETLAREAIRRKSFAQAQSEELRVLYVALTRARDALHILSSAPDLEKAADKWADPITPYSLRKSDCFADWLFPLVLRHDAGEKLRALCGAEPPRLRSDAPLALKIHEPAADVDAPAEKTPFRLPEPGARDERIERALSFIYPHLAETALPSKMTVTMLKPRRKDSPLRMEPPAFLSAAQKITAADRGTATHKLLSEMRLEAPVTQGSLRGQLDALVDGGKISARAAADIPIADIAWFFQTPLGQRALASRDIRREAPFTAPFSAKDLLPSQSRETILLQGTIDCCFTENGAFILLDYKTDRPTRERPVEAIAAEYAPQIRYYGRALGALTAMDVREKYLILLTARRILLIDD